MTVIHSSDLGWTSGQDISDEFAALAKTLKPGDTFVFDHMYKISGTDIKLANNVTLAGGAPGAGFEIQDFDQHTRPLLELGNANTLLNLTVKHKSVSASAETINGASIHAFGDDIQIINSSFEGEPKEFVRAGGDNLSVVDAVFDGAYYQMRWFGDATNFTVENSLFKNSDGDGIKTARAGDGFGTENATISNSVFMNNKRDGIDTTGGFKDSIVIDSYFVDNGVSGLDIKNIFEKSSDLSLNQTSRNVTITGSEFIDNGNNIVLTTLDRGPFLTNETAFDWMVQDIFIEDTIFENTGDQINVMVLAKGVTGVYADNVTFLGKMRDYKENDFKIFEHLTIDKNTNLNTSNLTAGDPRPGTLNVDYESMAGPDWTNISYPVDGTAAPKTPVVEPDPITYDPAEDTSTTSEPAPVVAPEVSEESDPVPVEVIAPVTSASDLLDVFVAYTDTDKTLSEIGAGSSIDSSLTEGRSLTIYAMSSGSGAGIGSVKLTVDGVGSRTESVEPYALFGDKNGDFLGGKQLSEGTYTAELVVFSGKNGSGDVLETVAFDFAVGDTGSTPTVTPDVSPSEPVQVDPVVEAPVEPVTEAPVETEAVVEASVEPEPTEVVAQAPDSQLLDIKLFDTGTDQALIDLRDGAKLSSGDLAGRKITLSAEAIGNGTVDIGSVKLELNDQFRRTENVEPYALFGDKNGDFDGGIELDDGVYSATLTAYSGKNGNGEVLEQVTLSFEVDDYDSLLFDGGLGGVSSYSDWLA